MSISGTQVTINPTVDLGPGSYYVMAASGVITDLAGNGFAGITSNTALNFTTVSVTDDFLSTTKTSGTISGGSNRTGMIGTSGDADWFRITMTLGKTYLIDLEGQDTGQGSASNPFLKVLSSTGAQLAADDDSGTGLNSFLSYAPTATGTFYLAASAASGDTGSYKLSVTEVDITGPKLSTTSPADNSTTAAATANLVLTFNEALAAGSGTIDIYRTSDNSLFKSIDISDGSQASISGSALTINPSTDFKPGTGYYVLLSAGVVQDAFGNPTAAISDPTKFNFTTATPVDDFAATTRTTGSISGGASKTGLIGSSSDADWFKITMTSGLTYLVNLEGMDTGQGSLGNPFLKVLSSTGAQLAGDDDGGTGLNAYLSYTATTSGTFYLAASGSGGDTGTYKLSVSVIDTTGPTLTTTSPADNSTTAAVTTNLVLTFNETIAAGSGTIGIYQSNGTLAKSIDITDGSQASLSGSALTINPATDLKPGMGYYVLVNPGVVQDTSGNLTAGVSDPTRFNFTTAVPKDDFTAATSTTGTITLGASKAGIIGSSSDADWFKISLTAGQTYYFLLEGQDSSQGTLSNPYLRLLSSTGSELIADDDSGTGANAMLSFTALTTGNHFLAVSGVSGDTGTYKLSAATTPFAAPQALLPQGMVGMIMQDDGASGGFAPTPLVSLPLTDGINGKTFSGALVSPLADDVFVFEKGDGSDSGEQAADWPPSIENYHPIHTEHHYTRDLDAGIAMEHHTWPLGAGQAPEAHLDGWPW